MNSLLMFHQPPYSKNTQGIVWTFWRGKALPVSLTSIKLIVCAKIYDNIIAAIEIHPGMLGRKHRKIRVEPLEAIII